MKKLALAIGLGAYVVFGASSGLLAAYRGDNTAGIAANRDSRIASGANARLLFLDQALYPDTDAAVVASPAAFGNQERADMAQPETSSAVSTSPAAHGIQERADMAQPETSSADAERLFCEGDICIVP